jgi:hypothetical protein
MAKKKHEHKPKHCFIIERRVKDDDEPTLVTTLATITKMGPIWMPTCMVSMCPKSGVALADESLLTALAKTVEHLEAEHGEKITSPS